MEYKAASAAQDVAAGGKVLQPEEEQDYCSESEPSEQQQPVCSTPGAPEPLLEAASCSQEHSPRAAPAAGVSQRYQLRDDSSAVKGCSALQILPYRAAEPSHSRITAQSELAAPEQQPLEGSPLSSSMLAEHTAFEAAACAPDQPGLGLRVEATCALIGRRGSSRGVPSFLVPVSDSAAPGAGCSRPPEEVTLNAHKTLIETSTALGVCMGPAGCQTWCLGWLTQVRMRLPHDGGAERGPSLLDFFTVRYVRKGSCKLPCWFVCASSCSARTHTATTVGASHPSPFGCGHCRGTLLSRATGPAGSTAAERVEASTITPTCTHGAPQSCRRGTAL